MTKSMVILNNTGRKSIGKISIDSDHGFNLYDHTLDVHDRALRYRQGPVPVPILQIAIPISFARRISILISDIYTN